ncbi:MAG: LysR family transcriptional regulator [Actinomycetota bacterium]|nr:LysR family transcriptional regulator [Actinomycetota bacterium]
MARTEWLRTFVAVHRCGSVTEAARRRAISQPAASQHLAGLERAVGEPLFRRAPTGMEPTEAGRALYLEVADTLDRLERVLGGLDAGRLERSDQPVRLGCTAEYLACVALPCAAAAGVAVAARFGDDEQLLVALERGELDVAITSTTPPRRSVVAEPLGERRFVLVVDPGSRPDDLTSLDELAAWLPGRPWVSYSDELPITRRFWQHTLGVPFGARLRLVAPDLRAVADAVALGLGVSLLPTYVCDAPMVEGRIVELFPVGDSVVAEPWFACTRGPEPPRADVAALVDALRNRRAGGP